MPPPASPYNKSKWQEAKEKRNRHSIARLTKALPVVYPANVLSRALNAVMKSQIFSIGNAVFFVFCFKQILATTPRRFHLEIIRCLESQSPVVDIIGRPYIEDNGTQGNTGGKHRPDFKAHRRGHAAKGVQPWAIAGFARLIPLHCDGISDDLIEHPRSYWSRIIG